ncbi:MAG TPA: alpha/beta fold hydrolase [Stellaceae bacterium]|nr:alpha/beta fold hydrolase [Stellaceae bacterium]
MTTAAQDRVIAVNGLTFRCRVDGTEGAPWLVFSNSMMTDLTLWDAQVAALGDRFRILRYDQRGHGGTSVSPGDCTFDQLVEDAVALFDVFGIGRAHVVGVSMGAATALRLAARFSDRIQSVVMADGQAATPPTGAQAWAERIDLARREGMAALVEPTIARWFRPAFIASGSPVLDDVRRMIRGTPIDGFARCARALQAYDFRDDLGKLRCPTLLLVGAADGALPATMRDMACSVTGALFVEIDEAGHLPNVEQPERFNAALTAFLNP